MWQPDRPWWTAWHWKDLTHWGWVTPYRVGKFHMVSDSRSGLLMSRASFQVPNCLCSDQWLLKWLVMKTAAASLAAAVCITRRFSNQWPRFPKFTRPQWVKGHFKMSRFVESALFYQRRKISQCLRYSRIMDQFDINELVWIMDVWLIWHLKSDKSNTLRIFLILWFILYILAYIAFLSWKRR